MVLDGDYKDVYYTYLVTVNGTVNEAVDPYAKAVGVNGRRAMVVDLDSIMRGNAPPFMLANGDIVYVPRSGMGSWNDVIADILPSLQAISSILQPFVSIKYLSD